MSRRIVPMSISALSSNLVTDLSQQQWQNPFKEIRQQGQGPNAVTQALEDYTQLSSDIQSGDLTDAETAYSSLQQLVGNPSPSNPTAIQTDFASLGQAIQSGDATQAQS